MTYCEKKKRKEKKRKEKKKKHNGACEFLDTVLVSFHQDKIY